MQKSRDYTQELRELVSGQDEILDEIAKRLRLHDSGLAAASRPVGAFLLLGPTGTGKTRTAEAVAEVLHGSRAKLLIVDCTQLQEPHEYTKLIGSAPSYVGYGEEPMLSAAKLKELRSERSGLVVVLFDELEKASASVERLLLGILDRAEVQLGSGERVSLNRTVVFCTSNIGSGIWRAASERRIGFPRTTAGSSSDRSSSADAALAAARDRWSPEFVNRFDTIAVFRPLEKATLERILDAQVTEVEKRFVASGHAVKLVLDDAARRRILDEGVSDEYGARELRRVFESLVLDKVASAIVPSSGKKRRGECLVEADVVTGELRAVFLEAPQSSDGPTSPPATVLPTASADGKNVAPSAPGGVTGAGGRSGQGAQGGESGWATAFKMAGAIVDVGIKIVQAKEEAEARARQAEAQARNVRRAYAASGVWVSASNRYALRLAYSEGSDKVRVDLVTASGELAVVGAGVVRGDTVKLQCNDGDGVPAGEGVLLLGPSEQWLRLSLTLDGVKVLREAEFHRFE